MKFSGGVRDILNNVKGFELEGTNEALSEHNWKLVDLEDIQTKAILKFSELFKP
jgi:hypothetical protein